MLKYIISILNRKTKMEKFYSFDEQLDIFDFICKTDKWIRIPMCAFNNYAEQFFSLESNKKFRSDIYEMYRNNRLDSLKYKNIFSFIIFRTNKFSNKDLEKANELKDEEMINYINDHIKLKTI
ncbi:Hypothetical protein KVN_LOCUS18 [uncultured virus]|nr:Hypothetical protein KVN_LOCUS18 [uncultured virus]